MQAYLVLVGVARGAGPDRGNLSVPVFANTRLRAAENAERMVNLGLDATHWAHAKDVRQIFPPVIPGPTAVAAAA